MPMARIDTIRVTKQADVEVELAKRSRNKQLREAVSMSERHAAFSSQGDELPNMLWVTCLPPTTTTSGMGRACAASRAPDIISAADPQRACVACRLQDAVLSWQLYLGHA